MFGLGSLQGSIGVCSVNIWGLFGLGSDCGLFRVGLECRMCRVFEAQFPLLDCRSLVFKAWLPKHIVLEGKFPKKGSTPS